MVPAPEDAARRQALLDAKLRALVGERWGVDAATGATAGTFPGGATLRAGGRGWVLAEDHPERSLGGALAWAGRAGVADLHLLLPRSHGAVARRAGELARPPAVWEVEGRSLRPARPAPFERESPVPDAALEFLDVLRGAGAQPVAEHGVLTGEVLGLEVARVVAQGSDAWLEVGVGKHDREAQRLVHGGRAPLAALASAVREVRRLRVAGAPSHPANLLSPERWLRAVLIEKPELAGARSLVAVASTVVRSDLRSRAPAPALGFDGDGAPVVVVCSAGIDPELVPVAADIRLATSTNALAPAPWTEHPWGGGAATSGGPAGRARLVVAVPQGDDHAVTRQLATALAEPAVVRTVPEGWRGMGGTERVSSLP